MTNTRKINGKNYKTIIVNCGRSTCQRCATGQGHPKIYVYDGEWVYFGTRLPAPDPNYAPPTCQRSGCTNPISAHARARFCSARCRVAANRARQ